MEAIKFKFNASQARSIYSYKKLKIKVLKCNADIYFNKQYLTKKIVPKYAKLRSLTRRQPHKKLKIKPKLPVSKRKSNSYTRKKTK